MDIESVHARVLSPTLAHENSMNKNKETEEDKQRKKIWKEVKGVQN